MLGFDPLFDETDADLIDVFRVLEAADPDGSRVAMILRSTFDQLYDGQHTGRFDWDSLYKTEKTHFGTVLEINLRRGLGDVIRDGKVMDFEIGGHEIDCKYSQRMGGWMIPPEARGHLLLVAHANDRASEWALGVVRATNENLRTSTNRDGKTSLSRRGVEAVRWLYRPGALAPNVLLQADGDDVDQIFASGSGQQRVNELFRRIQRRRIGRNTIATVAQQDDYMKRVRANGGARTALRSEGFLILGGDYHVQQELARQLGLEVPQPGEVVSVRVRRATDSDLNTVELDGSWWRVADDHEPTTEPAPQVPSR